MNEYGGAPGVADIPLFLFFRFTTDSLRVRPLGFLCAVSHFGNGHVGAVHEHKKTFGLRSGLDSSNSNDYVPHARLSHGEDASHRPLRRSDF